MSFMTKNSQPTPGPRSLAGVRNALLASVLLTPALPSAAGVIGSFTANGDGSYTYFYEVDNRGGAFDVALWSLEFDFATPDWNQLDSASGGDVGLPDPLWLADAGTPVTGLSAQDFVSLDPSADVAVGAVLGGFSFISSRAPGQVAYHQFSPAGDSSSGFTIGPVTAVPDGTGSTLGLLLIAAASGVALCRTSGARPAQTR